MPSSPFVLPVYARYPKPDPSIWSAMPTLAVVCVTTTSSGVHHASRLSRTYRPCPAFHPFGVTDDVKYWLYLYSPVDENMSKYSCHAVLSVSSGLSPEKFSVQLRFTDDTPVVEVKFPSNRVPSECVQSLKFWYSACATVTASDRSSNSNIRYPDCPSRTYLALRSVFGSISSANPEYGTFSIVASCGHSVTTEVPTCASPGSVFPVASK